MISVEFVKGPFNSDGILTAHPYELVGYFLSMELYRLRHIDWVLDAIERVSQGIKPVYASGVNAHNFRINSETIHIEEIEEYVGGPPLQCDVPLLEFKEVLLKWRAYLDGNG